MSVEIQPTPVAVGTIVGTPPKDGEGASLAPEEVDGAAESRQEVDKAAHQTIPSPPTETVSLCSLYRYASAADRVLLAVGTCALLVSSANQPAQLVVFGGLLDSFNDQSADSVRARIIMFAGIYAVLGVQQTITQSLQSAAFATVAARQARRLREKYFDSLMNKSMTFIDTQGSGQLASSVLDATTAMASGMGDDLVKLFQPLLSFVFGLAVALFYSWRLTLVSAAAIPVLGAVVAGAASIYSKHTQRSGSQTERATALALEAISSMRTIAAFGREKHSIDAYSEAVVEACAQGAAMGRASAMLEGTVAPIIFLLFAVGLWYGSSLISNDMEADEACRWELTNGTFQLPDSTRCHTGGSVMTAFLSVLFGFLGLLQAAPSVSIVANARVAAAKVFKVLEADDTRGSAPPPASAAGACAGKIEVVDVDFSYPSRREVQVYSGFCLTIEAGQTVALAGPSGCGKSTLVSLLERFYDVDGGAVKLDGVDIRELPLDWLRAQIGLVSQEPVLFSGSIEWNIRMGRDGATHEEVVEAAAKANALFVRDFPEGFATQVGEKGLQLSGGQKQRIAIARAIVRDPAVLVLDEATSALDTTSERVVQAALDELMRAKRRTTLVIAHRLSTIRDADVIAVVSNGRVVERGAHHELIERDGGLYRTLVEAQTEAQGAPADEHAVVRVKDVLFVHADAQKAEAEEKVAHVEAAVVEAVCTDDIEAAVQPAKPKPERTPTMWLWRLLYPDRHLFVSGLVGAAINGLASPAIGYLMAEFIVVFFNPDWEEMRREALQWAIVFASMGVANSVGAILKVTSFSLITERMVMRVRLSAYTSIMRQNIGWFDGSDDRTAGALVSQLSSDCYLLRGLTGERASAALSQMVVLGAGFYISFAASWALTLVVMGSVPLIVLPIAIATAKVGKYAEAATKAAVEAGSTVSETLSNMRTIAAFGLQDERRGTFARQLDLPLKQEVRKGVAVGVGGGVSAGAIMYAAALQYLVAAYFFDAGWVTFDEVLRVLLVLIFMSFGLGQISRDATNKADAMLAAKRINALLLLQSTIDPLNITASPPAKRAAGKIEVVDVDFSYPSRREVQVYNGFCLTIEAGQTVALAGPSGCGKSTLVSLLERFYDVDGGAVKLDGVDIRELPLDWLRAQIGLVSQEPVLFSGSIEWNIRMGRDGATHEEVVEAAAKANALFVRDFPEGFATQVGEKGLQLSGGQKQRIAIARAIVRDPAVLVLDEATSALDTTSERVVQAALDELMRAKRRTTLVIAHRLSTIRDADVIAVVSNGRVVERGAHLELIEREGGLYRSLVVHASPS
ncbi:hypothetical protein AB1Y20_006113 [Prymnesium parvum]|uniref:Bile salt export pump n=1 Tax=Prymnesium parvum TaxID=97485 RepID=A0AB34J1C4_PRYPA